MKKSEEKQLFERYKLIINARNFHYESFNKWMTFFYVATGAIFLGYCTIIAACNIDNAKQSKLEMIIPMVGYITSLFWYWSAKGYYYWNINFISLINHYEKDLLKLKDEDRVYFVFANKKSNNSYLNPISGANISTSKVTIFFAFVVSIIWCSLFIYNLSILQCDLILNIVIILLASLGLTLILSAVPFGFFKSDVSQLPDLKLDC